MARSLYEKVPFVSTSPVAHRPQVYGWDCGVACLSMIRAWAKIAPMPYRRLIAEARCTEAGMSAAKMRTAVRKLLDAPVSITEIRRSKLWSLRPAIALGDRAVWLLLISFYADDDGKHRPTNYGHWVVACRPRLLARKPLTAYPGAPKGTELVVVLHDPAAKHALYRPWASIVGARLHAAFEIRCATSITSRIDSCTRRR